MNTKLTVIPFGSTPLEIDNKIKRTIHTPIDGWKERTWYLCDVAFSSTNPVHSIMYFTGFLTEDGKPSGYSHLHSLNSETNFSIGEVFYLNPIRILHNFR